MAGATYKMRPEVARYLAPGVTYDPLRTPLYDRIIFASAVAIPAANVVFQIPVGQGTTPKTELDTNMRLAAQIPANHVYEIWSPRVYIRPVQPSQIVNPTAADVLTDVDSFIHGLFLRIKIVSQEKLLAPVWYLPGGGGMAGFAAFGTTVAAQQQSSIVVTNGEPNQFAGQRLDPFPIVVPPLQQFTVSLETGGAAGFTPQNNLHVWVVLDGILHRPALP
jgi:hypothetical protein